MSKIPKTLVLLNLLIQAIFFKKTNSFFLKVLAFLSVQIGKRKSNKIIFKRKNFRSFWIQGKKCCNYVEKAIWFLSNLYYPL